MIQSKCIVSTAGHVSKNGETYEIIGEPLILPVIYDRNLLNLLL